MDLKNLWQVVAHAIAAIPQSGLLIATLAALAGSWIGGALARRRVPFGRALSTLCTLGLGFILITVVLQVSRFDPRIDVAVPQLGLLEQTVVGGETRVPLADDGHFWLRATVNGVEAPFLLDTGATLTAVSQGLADRAHLAPRKAGVPVRIFTANGAVTAQLTTIDTLRFGNVEAGGIDAVIAPQLGDTNVIGMNVLSRLASWRKEGDELILVPANGDRRQ
jgi:aspartyl protease family protein